MPQQHIEDLTLGFAELEAWTLGRFPAARGDRPLVSAITGPFGTGKSHTMAVIRHLAQREGYVTARVEVDGQTISLAKPETFLYHLWGTTAARDNHQCKAESRRLPLAFSPAKRGYSPFKNCTVGHLWATEEEVRE